MDGGPAVDKVASGRALLLVAHPISVGEEGMELNVSHHTQMGFQRNGRKSEHSGSVPFASCFTIRTLTTNESRK